MTLAYLPHAEPLDLAGHCGRCRTAIHGDDGIRVELGLGRHDLLCSDACVRAEGYEQCAGCQRWHHLGNRPTVTSRGAYCSDDCVVSHERALLEARREKERRPSTCRVCHVHPSTPAYDWCCSVQCERGLFIGAQAQGGFHV